MTQVTITEAQKRLPELLSAAEAGETVTIRSDNGRTFSLVVQLSGRPSIPIGQAILTPAVPKD